MRTYTFHHYGMGGGASGMTFADFATDGGALGYGRWLLDQHVLGCVEVCDGSREVGAVRRDPVPPAGPGPARHA